MQTNDALRQRIKYVLENGEVYQSDKPLSRRQGLVLMGIIAVMQALQLALDYWF